MELREGKYYIARNGELVGPMVKDFMNGYIYGKTPDGFFIGEYHITDTVDNAARKHVEGN